LLAGLSNKKHNNKNVDEDKLIDTGNATAQPTNSRERRLS